MTAYLVNENDLVSIADIIRDKVGTSEPLVFPGDFISALDSIKNGDDIENKFVTRALSGEYINSKASVVGSYAFAYCASLTSVSFQNCTEIKSNAFASCFSLTAATFPQCSSIGEYAFYSCIRLSEINIPSCTVIGERAFFRCDNLISANFPMCTKISSDAFIVVLN